MQLDTKVIITCNSPVSTGLGWMYMQETDLKEHVVGCHSELAGVEHQAFSEQGEEAIIQHDLRFPPEEDIRILGG